MFWYGIWTSPCQRDLGMNFFNQLLICFFCVGVTVMCFGQDSLAHKGDFAGIFWQADSATSSILLHKPTREGYEYQVGTSDYAQFMGAIADLFSNRPSENRVLFPGLLWTGDNAVVFQDSLRLCSHLRDTAKKINVELHTADGKRIFESKYVNAVDTLIDISSFAYQPIILMASVEGHEMIFRKAIIKENKKGWSLLQGIIDGAKVEGDTENENKWRGYRMLMESSFMLDAQVLLYDDYHDANDSFKWKLDFLRMMTVWYHEDRSKFDAFRSRGAFTSSESNWIKWN